MMKIYRSVFAVLLGAVLLSTAEAAPQDQDFFEDFEGIPNTMTGAPFSLGSAPDSASLSGNAFAGFASQPALYHSGIRSWMVLENSVGLIEFADNNAAVVEFFIRTHPMADGDTIVTAFDDFDQIIGSPITIPTGDGFTLVSLSGSIDRIEIANNATNIMNGLDDFGFTTVPEPSSLVLGAIAIVASLTTRRRIQFSALSSRAV